MKPRFFIPTLYFMQGLPYTVVVYMSVVFLKNMGASNEVNTFVTSWFQMPWVVKALWAPAIDFIGTRRTWIVVSQAVLGVLSLLLAGVILLPNPMTPVLILLGLLGFASATQDIAMDGFYLDVLTKDEQAMYVGIRGTAFKLATLFGNGALVYFAGKLIESRFSMSVSWSLAFAVVALISFAACLLHSFKLPFPEKLIAGSVAPAEEIRAIDPPEVDLASVRKTGKNFKTDSPSVGAVLSTFFSQERIVAIVAFILIFRLGDAFMMKMAQLFLLDPLDKGGLNISTADVGLVYGTVGTIALLLGGITGGFVVARFGLKRCLMPSAIIQNSAILLYWYMALTKPGLTVVACTNAYEQFAYGIGVSAYTVFLLTTVKSEFKAAHYAIATALMACGVMIPGTIAGSVAKSLGYPNFFLVSFLLSLPGIILILFLPLKEQVKANVDTKPSSMTTATK